MGDVKQHYGHFLIGALSRIWALPSLDRKKLRLVFNGQPNKEALFTQPYMREIWSILGLSSENVSFFSEGILFKKIDVPASSFEENSHAHQVYSEMMKAIGHQIYSRGSRHERKQNYLFYKTAFVFWYLANT
ncbi:glycosyltransferase family 61 protein [Acetobacteraceae bacterium]|nr:glycosyltransferase family 61 protein [Acetobacteraceae bacterium]